MRAFRHLCVAAAVTALGVAMAPVAMAQTQADKEPAPWIKMASTGGCTFYLYDYDDPQGTWQKQWQWTWTGACVNGLASGRGDLTAAITSGSDRYTSGYRGTLVGGHLNGRIEEIQNGKMLADYYWQTFEMGCGDAAQYVYCVPYAGTTANTAPAQKPAAAPTPPPKPAAQATRVSGDASAIRAALGVENEDRVFAMLAELVQTGQIDLAREAQRQLTARFPNSQLLPMAVQLINALSQPAPAAGNSVVTPRNAGVAATGGVLTIANIRQMLESELGFTTTNIAGAGEDPVYELSAQRDGMTIPVSFSVSPNAQYVWARVRLLSTAVPQQVAAAAMTRAVDIQPTMFWTHSNGMWLGMAKENRGVTASDLRAMIDIVLGDTVSTRDIWGG